MTLYEYAIMYDLMSAAKKLCASHSTLGDLTVFETNTTEWQLESMIDCIIEALEQTGYAVDQKEIEK